jgi:hypothetical protein
MQPSKTLSFNYIYVCVINQFLTAGRHQANGHNNLDYHHSSTSADHALRYQQPLQGKNTVSISSVQKTPLHKFLIRIKIIPSFFGEKRRAKNPESFADELHFE